LAGIDPGVRSVAEQQRQRHQKEDSRHGVAAHTAATAGARVNLISGVRSFVPLVAKKDQVPPVAAGKVKVKVCMLCCASPCSSLKCQACQSLQMLPMLLSYPLHRICGRRCLQLFTVGTFH
jgi:hypothetical protein